MLSVSHRAVSSRGLSLLFCLAVLFGFINVGRVHRTIFVDEALNAEGVPEIVNKNPSVSNNIEASITVSNDKAWKLPKWITDYIAWHNQVRSKFTVEQLLQDDNAPNIIVSVLVRGGGGLHDRLGNLPFEIYLANQTGRVLFIKWFKPHGIENFLVPALFNWTLPEDVLPTKLSLRHDAKELFQGMWTANSNEEWAQVQSDIQRATSGDLRNSSILVYTFRTHTIEHRVEKELLSLRETDMIHSTPSYGKLFHAFFQPSPAVRGAIEAVRQDLGLIPGQYTAVHCRVRHPQNFDTHAKVVSSKGIGPPDMSGLPFQKWMRKQMIEIANHAIQCARTLSKSADEPIYFFSDSNDLVNFFVNDLRDETWRSSHVHVLTKHELESQANSIVSKIKLVGRRDIMKEEIAHLDRAPIKNSTPAMFFPTFVDFYLAVGARCVTFGFGNYGLFPVKVSHSDCMLRHRHVYEDAKGKRWTTNFTDKICTKDMYKDMV